MTSEHVDILLLDLGTSVPKISERLGYLGVTFKVASWGISPQEIARIAPKGIIMSGSGASVLDRERPKPNYKIYTMGIPIYGICYGFQVMTHQLGGQVIHSELPEPGLLSQVTMIADCKIVRQVREFDAWFLHFDSIHAVPKGFQVVASSVNNRIAMAWDPERQFYGTLFHPERTDTTTGAVDILDSFVQEVALKNYTDRYERHSLESERAFIQAQEHILNLDVHVTKTLDLSGIGLEKIPSEIVRLKNLEKLYINRNPLKELPPEIGQLKHLKTLAIYGGQLKELPIEIGALSELEYLAVYGNLLESLPRSIGHLTNLKTLAVDNNRIKQLPSEIGQLENLLWLQLNHNEIMELPKEIVGLKNLNGIRLSYNKLRSLPLEFGYLNKLLGMSISHNFLTELPDTFCNLSEVMFIELDDNRLTKLPNELRTLQKVSVLRLKGNNILQSDPVSMDVVDSFRARLGVTVTI